MPTSVELGRLEKVVLDWQKVLTDISLLGKKIASGCEGSQSRSVVDTCEEIERRWRMVVKEVTCRKSTGEIDREGGNMNLIVIKGYLQKYGSPCLN